MREDASGPFIVIGENIHATRAVLRNGPRVRQDQRGTPVVPFTDETHRAPIADLGRRT